MAHPSGRARAKFLLKCISSSACAMLVAALAACGGGGNGTGNDSTQHSGEAAYTDYVVKPATSLEASLELFAGSNNSRGVVDDSADLATFARPIGLVDGKDGSLYVADQRSIRRVSPDGNVTTIAGLPTADGSADGIGADARFSSLGGIAMDGTGNVYVTDSRMNTVRRIDRSGNVTTLAGTPGIAGHADGTGAAASFRFPAGIAVDPSGNVYVHEADPYNPAEHRLRKIDQAGQVTTLAVTSMQLRGNGIAIDANGQVFVMANVQNETIPIQYHVTDAGPLELQYRVGNFAVIRLVRISPDGQAAVLASLPDVLQSKPGGMAIDPSGNVYLADTGRSEVLKYSPQDNAFAVLAGTPGPDMFVESVNMGATCVDPYYIDRSGNHLCHPTSIALDPSGALYVAEALIRRIQADGVVSDYAGMPGRFAPGDGPAFEAGFGYTIGGIAVAPDNTVYVSDSSTVRRIANDAVTTIAGSVNSIPGALVNPVDGTGVEARFSSLGRMASDAFGNLYVIDRSAVRKITADGTVTTIAGDAMQSGHVNGTGSAARLSPVDIAASVAGDVYIAEHGLIRKMSASGEVVDFAGNRAYPDGLLMPSEFSAEPVPFDIPVTDGPGATATFRRISAMTIDRNGNLLVVDTNLIRKIDPSGNVTTLAQFRDLTPSGEVPYGSQAICVDLEGNVYVNNVESNVLRKVTGAGAVTTLFEGQVPYNSTVPGIQTLALYASDTLLVGMPGGIFKLRLAQK